MSGTVTLPSDLPQATAANNADIIYIAEPQSDGTFIAKGLPANLLAALIATKVSISAPGSGSWAYLGSWDANANFPLIVSGQAPPNTANVISYYVVTQSSDTTTIDGVSVFNDGDWIIWQPAQSKWSKLVGSIDSTVINSGARAPVSSDGNNGEFWLDTATSVLYGPKAAGAWPGSGLSLRGADGNTLLYGTGAPASGLGVNGNFYIDTAANVIYGPKAGGAWPGGISLVGPAGNNGTNGVDGNTVLSGSGAPANSLGVNNNFYIDTVGHMLYGPKAAGIWPAGVSLVGPAGTNGNTVLSGTGAPGSGLGVNGNFYIDTAASELYGPKAAGAWPAGVSLIGPAGTNGTNGTNGNTVLYGTGAPGSGLGVNGNFYIDTAASELYGPKASGAWPAGVSLIGPAGPPGSGTNITASTATTTIAPTDYIGVSQGGTDKKITGANFLSQLSIPSVTAIATAGKFLISTALSGVLAFVTPNAAGGPLLLDSNGNVSGQTMGPNFGIATVAALEALPFASLADGMVAAFSAYNVQGDGGGGLAQWQASSTLTVDYVFVFPCSGNPGSSGRWIRQYSGIPSYKMAGMPISGTGDATAAITRFWNALSLLNGGKGGAGWGDDGIWNQSAQIPIPPNISMTHGSGCFYQATALIAGAMHVGNSTGFNADQFWVGAKYCLAFLAQGAVDYQFAKRLNMRDCTAYDKLLFDFRFGSLGASPSIENTILNLRSEYSTNYSDVPQTAVPTQSVAITSATLGGDGRTVTLQLAGAHGMDSPANATFTVSGLSPSAYNVSITSTQSGTIGYATAPDVLTYQVAYGTAAPSGTGSVTVNVQASKITNWGPSWSLNGAIWSAGVMTISTPSTMGIGTGSNAPAIITGCAPAGWNIVAPFVGAAAGTILTSTAMTIPWAVNPAGTTNPGVSQANLSLTTNGTGYTASSQVPLTFSAPSVGGGSAAQGYALITSTGTIQALVVTNPGNYPTGSSVPTVTIGGGGTGGTATVAALAPCSVATTLGTVMTRPTSNFPTPLNTAMPNGSAGVILCNLTDSQIDNVVCVNQDIGVVLVGSVGGNEYQRIHPWCHTNRNQQTGCFFQNSKDGNSRFFDLYSDGSNLFGLYLGANNNTVTDTLVFKGNPSGLNNTCVGIWDNYGNNIIKGLVFNGSSTTNSFGTTGSVLIYQDIAYATTAIEASDVVADIDVGFPSYLSVRTILNNVTSPGTVPPSQIYIAGDTWQSTDPVSAGSVATCITGGYYATVAWTQSTVVPSSGYYQSANGNVYESTSGGTTASTGTGPSGTGTAISDGTGVIWKYIAPLAVFSFPPVFASYTSQTALPLGVTQIFGVSSSPIAHNTTLNVNIRVNNASTLVYINVFYYDAVSGLNTTLNVLGVAGTTLAVGSTSYAVFLQTSGLHGVYVQVQTGTAGNVIANGMMVIA
jgi:hypothetical protein